MADTLLLGGVFVLGLLLGVGATLLYLQWRTRRQLQQMGDALDDMMLAEDALPGEMEEMTDDDPAA